MKKLLLCACVLLPMHAIAGKNSVYEWGPWAEGVQPAAGPVNVAPAPVENPQTDVRESMALQRRYNSFQPPAPITPGTGVHVVDSTQPINTAPPSVVTDPLPPPGL